MKKTILSALSILLVFSGLVAQKSELTIHNKNGFKLQKGYLVDGYKEGEWIKIDRRNDTTYVIYEQGKEKSTKRYKKKTYGAYKGLTLVESKYRDYRKNAVSNFSLTTHRDKVYHLEKNITCPYYSKPFYRYYLTGDSRTVKTIIQQLDLRMTLYPLKDHFGTQYDNSLKNSLPNYGKVEFSIDPETGDRMISNLIMNYQGKKIEQRRDGEFFMIGDDRYELLTSINYFFLERSEILLKKNGAIVLRQRFDKGLPVSFTSYFDNGDVQLNCKFKNGLPHGEFSSFYEEGNKKLECVFDEGVLQGQLSVYDDKDGLPKYTVFLKDGKIDGLVKGKNKVLLFKDDRVLQLIEVDELGKVKNWKSGNNKYSRYKNKEELKADGVKYTFDIDKNEFTQFSCNAGETHFSYSDYGKRDMILINYHENKENWFSLYIQKDGEIKGDINLTLDGENLRDKKTKYKLKLIKKRFMNVSKLAYPNTFKVQTTTKGDTMVRTISLSTGSTLLEEKFLDGKLTGKRLMWGLKGNVIQEVNYKENHNEGLFVSYNSKGEIQEKGNFRSSVKSGEWMKIERDVKYEYLHENSNTAKRIKSYFKSGQVKSIYIVTNTGNYSKIYKEDGSVKSEYKRNKKGKIHGPYYTTWGKGKSAKGTYLNGYRHGKFDYYNEKGQIENTVYFDYGRKGESKKKEESSLNSICVCPQEFNVINGSSYYPKMEDILSYNSFDLMFKDVFSISEKGYGKIFIRGLNNSHSSNNTARFYGMDMIVFPTSNTFQLPQYNGIELVLTPCAKSGELANRGVTINTNHPLIRYVDDFDEDGFEMTSKNVFNLLIEMMDGGEEEFIKSSSKTMEELKELTKYLRKNKFKVSTSDDYKNQLKLIVDYIDKEDKEEEFFELMFKKKFDYGELDKKTNPSGYAKFDQAIRTNFDGRLRNYTIAKLKEGIINIEARMTMEGGRYAFQHPHLVYKEKETPLFFSCKSISVKKEIRFNEIKDICIQPNAQLKGTKFEIIKVNSVQMNSPYQTDKMSWNCRVQYKGVRKDFPVVIAFEAEKVIVTIKANNLSKNEIYRLTKELKTSYDGASQSIVYELTGQTLTKRMVK